MNSGSQSSPGSARLGGVPEQLLRLVREPRAVGELALVDGLDELDRAWRRRRRTSRKSADRWTSSIEPKWPSYGVIAGCVAGRLVVLEELLAVLVEPGTLRHAATWVRNANRFSGEEGLLAGQPLVEAQEEGCRADDLGPQDRLALLAWQLRLDDVLGWLDRTLRGVAEDAGERVHVELDRRRDHAVGFAEREPVPVRELLDVTGASASSASRCCRSVQLALRREARRHGRTRSRTRCPRSGLP